MHLHLPVAVVTITIFIDWKTISLWETLDHHEEKLQQPNHKKFLFHFIAQIQCLKNKILFRMMIEFKKFLWYFPKHMNSGFQLPIIIYSATRQNVQNKFGAGLRIRYYKEIPHASYFYRHLTTTTHQAPLWFTKIFL